MRRFFGIALFCLITAVIPAISQNEQAMMPGYTAENARTERDWENKFRAIPSPDNMKADMQRLAARPHAVGQPYDKDNTEWLLNTFKSWGLDAHVETFDVLFPTPKDRVVELVEPTKFTAKLQEPTVAVDPTSSQHAEQLPTYNAYSKDGDVTGPLVFVNYGIPEDYDELDRLGISVKGAIVITKYGGSWRGIKPKVAAEHGAIGCLIYSDPKDDGYYQGDVYPKGPFRPKDGVQRGSVADMPLYPGDPLTPGVGATPEAKRVPLNEAATITKIPVLPISYGDAQPLLENLSGPVAPDTWRGALPITYHVGPGPSKVHLRVMSNWDRKPVNDVIVKITGSTYPDEWIVRGNHYDGWVNGAQDPISGAVAEMEELRAYSELLKSGWKPKRTIIYAFWDGEEPGLLGSTEFAEAHADELKQHTVMYLNSDSNSRGYLGMSGSHSLEHFFNDVAKDITDPEKQTSVWKRLQAAQIYRARDQQAKQEVRNRPNLRIGALGSGSDYTAYLDFLGIASANFGYGGEASGGIYHSVYDDYYWFSHFDDPDEIYGKALAQTAGTAVMRMANADLLPFDFNLQADTVQRYVSELQKLATEERDKARETNRELDDGVYNAVNDPKKPMQPPKREEVPPYLNFAPLQNGADALTHAAERYQKVFQKAQADGGTALAQASLTAVNQKLIQSERALTTPEGLPNRSWFKHQLYAPGFYTGYGVKTIPAVREAIEQKQWQLADEQIVKVGKVLENEAAVIDQAAAALEGATK